MQTSILSFLQKKETSPPPLPPRPPPAPADDDVINHNNGKVSIAFIHPPLCLMADACFEHKIHEDTMLRRAILGETLRLVIQFLLSPRQMIQAQFDGTDLLGACFVSEYLEHNIHVSKMIANL